MATHSLDRGRARTRDQAAHERALDALALARREGLSLAEASRLTGLSPEVVLREAGAGFRREGGRWVARPFDRLPREMAVLTATGPEWVMIRDSRTASLVAAHANAVRAYVQHGDEEPLRRLPRRGIRVGGRTIALETDPVRLDRLAGGGELHYELYRH